MEDSGRHKRKQPDSVELDVERPAKLQRVTSDNSGDVFVEPTTLIFQLVSLFIDCAETVVACNQVCKAWNAHVKKSGETLWKQVTLSVFRSYPFFHKELAESFDAAAIGPISALPIVDDDVDGEDEVNPNADLVKLNDAVEEELGEEKALLNLENVVEEEMASNKPKNQEDERACPWERFYKYRLRFILKDFELFKSIVVEKGIEWRDEFASALRLGIYLIPNALTNVSIRQEEAGETPSYKPEWEQECRSAMASLFGGEEEEDDEEDDDKIRPRTTVGGPIARPLPANEDEEATAHPGTSGGVGFMAQLVLSDFKGMLTCHGRFPSSGLVSLYYWSQDGQVFFEPDMDAHTECTLVEPPEGECAPFQFINGFVECLFVDEYSKAFEELAKEWKVRIEIIEAYNERRRVGRIPIEQTHIIGGQCADFQGNHIANEGEFQLLQTDIDSGALFQIFFIIKEDALRKLDFSSLKCGDSLSR